MDERVCPVAAVRSLGADAVAIDVESPPDFTAQPGQFVKLTFAIDSEDDGSEDAGSENGGSEDGGSENGGSENGGSERGDSGASGSDGGEDDANDGTEEISRFYTISSPDVDETFELTIEIDPEGELGPYLADLAAGDELVVSGPFGRDYYEGEPRVVVIAGGPGVGPAVGIAERALADGGAAAVVYRDADPLFEERLADVEADGGFVRVLDADESLDDAVADAIDAGEVDPQLFVYGFAEFIGDATAAIERAGGDADRAKIENFG